MAEPDGAPAGLGPAFRAAMDAHARYVEAWGQLASRWMLDLAEASKETRLPRLRLSTASPIQTSAGSASTQAHASAAPAEPPSTPASASDATPAPAVLVLEGAAGDTVAAAFLVENILAHPVDGVVDVEPFEDPDGATVLAQLTFEPAGISLAPGERQLVRVSVALSPTLPANVDCRSTIRVQGVPGTTIPILIRRLGD
jgi:hypothetical protein